MIEQLVYAMALGQVEQDQADLFMTHLCRVSNVSRAVFPDLVKVIYQCLAEETKQKIVPDLNQEQLQACKLLNIPPHSLTEQTLQVAYRKRWLSSTLINIRAYPNQYSSSLNNRLNKSIKYQNCIKSLFGSVADEDQYTTVETAL